MDGNYKEIESEFSFECCFCNEGIKETHTDPCDINIVINAEIKKKDRAHKIFIATMNV